MNDNEAVQDEAQRSPRRPSLVETVKLADGSLAWPVARDNGVSETLFRWRLKKMSPDRAATDPVQARDTSRWFAAKADERKRKWAEISRLRRLAESRLLTAEKRAGGVPLAARFSADRERRFAIALAGGAGSDMSGPDYAGVLVESGERRLAVLLDGSAFVVQSAARGRWATDFKSQWLTEIVDALEPDRAWQMAAAIVRSIPRECVARLAAGYPRLRFCDDRDGPNWILENVSS